MRRPLQALALLLSPDLRATAQQVQVARERLSIADRRLRNGDHESAHVYLDAADRMLADAEASLTGQPVKGRP